MNSCIVCGEDSGFGMICEDCKDTIKYYKKVYLTNKALTETTTLDDQMFDILYKTAGIDEIVHDDVYSFLPSSTDELIEDIKEALYDCLPKENWLTQQEGRMDGFLAYVRKRIDEEKSRLKP